MKKLFFALLFIFAFNSYSQENYTYKSGGRIFDSNNKKIKADTLRAQFKDNTDFLKLYNSGRTKKTVGNLLLISGISTVIIKHISVKNKVDKAFQNQQYTSTNNILYFVGGGLIVAAIPIKIGYSKKIKKSVEVLNSSNNSKSVGYVDSSFILDSNGFGLKIQF